MTATTSAAGAFGVRRPLRFLAYKLELDERQVAELARILDELKTERAQAEVDRRRTLSAFADAVARRALRRGEGQGRGRDLRVSSAERLRDAVTKALGRIHALLDKEQRERLAYLIRTGTSAALTVLATRGGSGWEPARPSGWVRRASIRSEKGQLHGHAYGFTLRMIPSRPRRAHRRARRCGAAGRVLARR